MAQSAVMEKIMAQSAVVEKRTAQSRAKLDEKNKIAFIALNYQGADICEFGCVFVDSNTLNPSRYEHEFIKLPNHNKGEEFRDIRRVIYKALHEKVWIYHGTNIDDLMKLFSNLGVELPKAECKIDTTDWYIENFEKEIVDQSLEGIFEHFGLGETELEEPEEKRLKRDPEPKALLDCHKHIDVLNVSLGVKGLKNKLAEVYAEMKTEKQGRELRWRKVYSEHRWIPYEEEG